jgi:iron complex transport system substrate-binding protein
VNPAPLAAANLPLTVVKTDRIDDIATAMDRLGKLLDAPGAPRAAQALRERLAAQRRVRAHAPRVLFVAWASPLYVGGRDTFAGDLIALCGGRNAVEISGWPQYSVESVAAAPPDVILASARLDLGPLLAAAPGVAAKSRIAGVDENRFTRPGPRVAEAASELNRILDAWERSKAASEKPMPHAEARQ